VTELKERQRLEERDAEGERGDGEEGAEHPVHHVGEEDHLVVTDRERLGPERLDNLEGQQEGDDRADGAPEPRPGQQPAVVVGRGHVEPGLQAEEADQLTREQFKGHHAKGVRV